MTLVNILHEFGTWFRIESWQDWGKVKPATNSAPIPFLSFPFLSLSLFVLYIFTIPSHVCVCVCVSVCECPHTSHMAVPVSHQSHGGKRMDRKRLRKGAVPPKKIDWNLRGGIKSMNAGRSRGRRRRRRRRRRNLEPSG